MQALTAGSRWAHRGVRLSEWVRIRFWFIPLLLALPGPRFGIRQLVDVATQALSPAINQPTTAVLVIDRLHDLLLRIARLPTPTGLHVDVSGAARLVESTYSWDYLLHLEFVEVTALGISSPHVTRRLAAALRDLRANVPSEAAPEVARVQAALDELLREHVIAGFAGLASTPDRLGLG